MDAYVVSYGGLKRAGIFCELASREKIAMSGDGSNSKNW